MRQKRPLKPVPKAPFSKAAGRRKRKTIAMGGVFTKNKRPQASKDELKKNRSIDEVRVYNNIARA